MKKSSKWMGFVYMGALLLGAAGAGASPINLVTNGGFEEGPVASSTPTGWTYTQASFLASAEVVTGANSGKYAYGFSAGSPSGRGDIISQNIPTTPGTQYTLSFYGLNAYPNSNAIFDVWWDKLSGVAIYGSNGSDFGHTAYKHFTFTVTGGSGTSTVLGFEGQAAGGTAFVIDDISITAVPEPASLALLLVGSGVLLLRRRRAEV